MGIDKWVRMDETQWGFPKTRDIIYYVPIDEYKEGKKIKGYVTGWYAKCYKIIKNNNKRALKIVKTKKEAVDFIRLYIKKYPKGF